jgi:hypothetical protein
MTTPKPINDTFLCGRPFYCAVCGVGLGEWLECDRDDCELESHEVAQDRLRKAHISIKFPGRAA